MTAKMESEARDQAEPIGTSQSVPVPSPTTAILIALLALCFAWQLAWYWETWASMVSIWYRSETFAHGFIILPISAWLIWRRRAAVAVLRPRLCYLAVPLLAVAGFAWLMGHLGGVIVVQQYAQVSMLLLLFWALVGSEIAGTIAFPLLFLFFMVPVGEIFIPPMIEFTADFTVAALRLSGIPVFREGTFFNVPSGSWSVVEACSGLRYLIASLTIGVLYAYLTYSSFLRRSVFVVISIIVPILANGLRAYMVVMIGHLSSNRLATGVDHIIYGWIFFGFVMVLLFWVGSFWRQDTDPRIASIGEREVTALPERRWSLIFAAAAFLTLTMVWPLWGRYLDGQRDTEDVSLVVPAGAGGWVPVDAAIADWNPHFLNSRASRSQVYQRGDARVGLHVMYYRNQVQDRELITSQNKLVSTTDEKWGNLGQVQREIEAGGQHFTIQEAVLKSGTQLLLVRYVFRSNGRHTGNPYVVKLIEATSRLLGRGDESAVIMAYVAFESDKADVARIALDAFLPAMVPSIDAAIDHAKRL